MSALQKVAVAMNKGHPSAYYDQNGTQNVRSNPVFQAYEQEFQRFVTAIKKRKAPGFKPNDKEPACKLSDALSSLLNNYQNRLPLDVWKKNMMEVVDFLFCMQEYGLALWQCYDRMLITTFNGITLEHLQDAESFRLAFFPSGFDDSPDTIFALRALMGHLICTFHLTRMTDPYFNQSESVEKCQKLLLFLQSILQWLLPMESLYWLVFNGTVHIYTISRYLMSFGHSSKVTDYLLWACVCLESSVPLLSVKYLTWRSTLYTSVCQCYYDCKLSHYAELFARRALGKVNELNELEKLSNVPPSKETETAFRTTTIKMALMIFKRAVVESRRRPKGVLRPKNRLNVKEVSQGPWPRTMTEKLLVSMFQGSSAQALALMEALMDSNRRTLINSLPAADANVEVLDVYVELFLAAQEIIAGGGGDGGKGQSSSQKNEVVKVPGMDGIVPEQSMMDLAIKGGNGIPLSQVVTIVKAAYCYQQYDFFDVLLPKTLASLQELQNPKLAACELDLRIIQAFDKATGRSRNKKAQDQYWEDDGKPTNEDDLLNLTNNLLSILTTKLAPGVEVDKDIISDALIFLWNKCKTVLHRFQSNVTINNPKYIENIKNKEKWIAILDGVYHVMVSCGLGNIDSIMIGEAALRLALLYEATAMLRMVQQSGDQYEKVLNEGHMFATGESFNCDIIGNIQRAKDVLQTGLKNLSTARDHLPKSSQTVVDVSLSKELNPDLVEPRKARDDSSSSNETLICQAASKQEHLLSTANMARDLQTELLFHYHRLCIKNARLSVFNDICNDEHEKTKVPWTLKSFQATDLLQNWKTNFNKSCEDLLRNCRHDKLSCSLFYMQRALTMSAIGQSTDEQKKSLSEALNLLRQLEAEEKNFFRENSNKVARESFIPPPPVLIVRTETFMVFEPPNFKPSNGQKVVWYRIFAHQVSGNNVKARLNDIHLPGTGDQVSVLDKEMKVSGLVRGEKYVFAVAAYSSDGELIGGSVGKSTKPILASHPLSLLSAWSYLAQVSYSVACHDVALEAFQVIWNHIVAPSIEPESEWSVRSIELYGPKLTVHRLNMKVVNHTSPILLHSVLLSLFVGVDVQMKERSLYCDLLCDQGPLTKGQLGRIQLCEKMLIAMELAGWLNETNLALQSVVQCYGLLAPLLYFKISYLPLTQVLERCIAVLQEIPGSIKQKFSSATVDGLQHMTACMAYHLAKVLRFWGETNLADAFNNIGRKLLAPNYDPDKDRNLNVALLLGEEQAPVETKVEEKTPGSEKNSGEKLSGREDKSDLKTSVQKAVAKGDMKNTELSALEAHLTQMNKQVQPKLELSGNEDQSILHGFIAYLPSALAYKQLKKFRGKSHYVEFLLQVIQKALAEGNSEMAATWCEEAELLFATAGKKTANKGASRQSKDISSRSKDQDEEMSFRAAVVEFSKGGKQQKAAKTLTYCQRKAGQKDKEGKTKNVAVEVSSDPAKQRQQLEAQARAVLKEQLTKLVEWKNQQKKRLKLASAEIPWRCQLNVLHGLSYFAALLNKLRSINPLALDFVYRTSFLDLDWFHLENSRTLLGDGSAAMEKESMVTKDPQALSLTPIEQAADAVAVRRPEGGDFSTPRSTRLGFESTPQYTRTARGKVRKEEIPMVTRDDMADSMEKTFTYFTRAIVLAHRGHHWTLLQNICKDFWNCLQMAQVAAQTPAKNGKDLLDAVSMRGLSWKPVYCATDCLLDMLQQNLKHLVEVSTAGKGLVESPPEATGKGLRNQLKVISSMDDMTSVDMHSIRCFAMRSIELLFLEELWEKLVDVGLRFGFLTNGRYSEPIGPLIIHAQQKLIARITENGGNPSCQPHFDKAVAANQGLPIQHEDYINLQLKVSRRRELPNADSVDSHQRALQLSSVPLDVAQSIRNLKQTVEESSDSSRALEESRKLLVLFLAGKNYGRSNSTSLQQRLSQQGMLNLLELHPEHGKDQDHSTAHDIYTHDSTKTEIGSLIESYEKTIAALHKDGLLHLETEALRELGNLHFYTRNLKGAGKQWAICLDLLLGESDVIHSWRSLFRYSSDVPTQLLQKAGIWGCLLGGIICSNIAQYVLTSDVDERIECCLLASCFFKGLLRSSLPHPLHDRSYATYKIGANFEVTDLIPGVDLLSDRFRCDVKTVIAAIRFVSAELAQSQHGLTVLPLTSLDQYFTSSICRDVKRYVEGVILKVQILTDLHLFGEAGLTLSELLHGENLPQMYGSMPNHAEPQPRPYRFSACLPVMEENNLYVLELISEKRLSVNLRTLYGPHLTCRLALVQAHFLVAIAKIIPDLPSTDETAKHWEVSSRRPFLRQERSTKPSVVKPPTLKQQQDSGTTDTVATKKQEMGLDVVKARLLASADQILIAMSDVLTNSGKTPEGAKTLVECEVELLVQVKLELASVALQKQHPWIAARTIFSAMKVLKEANCFQDASRKMRSRSGSPKAKKKTAPTEESQTSSSFSNAKSQWFVHQNFCSRSRLNGRLWLSCRLALVKSLMEQVKGVGQIPGVEQQVVVEIADVEVYCRRGLEEAEMFGGIEAQVEFLYLGAQLHIINGKPVQKAVQILQEVEQMLSQQKQLSFSGHLIMANSLLLKADMLAVMEKERIKSALTARIDRYANAQAIVLQQLEDLGESVKRRNDGRKEFSTLCSPIQNLYSPHLSLLIQLKMKIGHALALLAAEALPEEDPSEATDHWNEALCVLSNALQLSYVIISRIQSIEAELLLYKGQIERQLCHLNKYGVTDACETLMRAIRTSISSDHSLSLIRKAYLELALVCTKPTSTLLAKTNPQLDASGTTEESEKNASKPVAEGLEEALIAWTATNYASTVSKTLLDQQKTAGNESSISDLLGNIAAAEMPEFIGMDMVGSNVIGTKIKIYKNEIEEELAPLTEELHPSPPDTYESQLQSMTEAASQITWMKVFAYQNVLQRLCSSASINTTEDRGEGSTQERFLSAQGKCSESEVFSESRQDVSLVTNYAITASLPFTTSWVIRLEYVHRFLKKWMPWYANQCDAIGPPKILYSWSGVSEVEGNLPVTTYVANTIPDAMVKSSGSQSEIGYKLSRTDMVEPKVDELCFQWYSPSIPLPAMSGGKEVILLIADFKRPKDYSVRRKVFPISQLLLVHERLNALAKHKELIPEKFSAIKTSEKQEEKTAKTTSSDEVQRILVDIEQFLNDQGKSKHDVNHEGRRKVASSQKENKNDLGLEKHSSNSVPSEKTQNRDFLSGDLNTNLSCLEELFNPAMGAIVGDKSMVSWLRSVLS